MESSPNDSFSEPSDLPDPSDPSDLYKLFEIQKDSGPMGPEDALRSLPEYLRTAHANTLAEAKKANVPEEYLDQFGMTVLHLPASVSLQLADILDKHFLNMPRYTRASPHFKHRKKDS